MGQVRLNTADAILKKTDCQIRYRLLTISWEQQKTNTMLNTTTKVETCRNRSMRLEECSGPAPSIPWGNSITMPLCSNHFTAHNHRWKWYTSLHTTIGGNDTLHCTQPQVEMMHHFTAHNRMWKWCTTSLHTNTWKWYTTSLHTTTCGNDSSIPLLPSTKKLHYQGYYRLNSCWITLYLHVMLQVSNST